MRKKLIIIPLGVVLILGVAVGIYFSSFASFYATLNNVAVISGQNPSPYSFFAFYENGEYVEPEIIRPTSWPLSGQVQVTIGLNQGRRGFRFARQNAYVHILQPAPYVAVEVGTPVESILPQAFLSYACAVPDDTLFETEIITDLSGLTDSTGRHRIILSLNGAYFTSTLRVENTTPPNVVTANVTTGMGEAVFASSFITHLSDTSPSVTIQFAEGGEPDVFRVGEQQVSILATDYYGNEAVSRATLTVLPNTVPPRIVGARNIQLAIDGSAMFRLGVSAYDAFGRPIDFTVNSDGVDASTLGVYPVTYRAVDCCGNYTEVTVRVYVVAVDPEEVRARATEVLDRIIYDNMSQVEQARAIFNWVTANVGYAAGFEHRTVYESANQALVHRRGDCFVFYSISELLLTMAGIPNMRIDRVGGTSRHAWNLINPDDMGWHHFDTTPLVVRQIDRFMFTQTQAEEFTRIIHNAGQGRDYFTFDPSLYPEIVR
ncbi:MAG: transglutaminase-like domain-containing protein [Firmicutes bacterium]|nr:transglutaminase-like domain-containing protein [Bacillota bacterium]